MNIMYVPMRLTICFAYGLLLITYFIYSEMSTSMELGKCARLKEEMYGNRKPKILNSIMHLLQINDFVKFFNSIYRLSKVFKNGCYCLVAPH